MTARPLRIALLGCGVVGTEVVRLLTEQSADLEARIGAPLELVGIAVGLLWPRFAPKPANQPMPS